MHLVRHKGPSPPGVQLPLYYEPALPPGQDALPAIIALQGVIIRLACMPSIPAHHHSVNMTPMAG